MDTLIMTPSDPGFYEILHTSPPPGLGSISREQSVFVVDAESGMLRPCFYESELDEYLDAEYDVMMDKFGNCDDWAE